MRLRLYLCCFILLTVNRTFAQEPRIPVHDPVMAKQGDTWYLFCTGQGISSWSSKDLKSWKREKPVFNTPPQWALAAIPGFKGHIWAPDISYYNGLYYLYYSVSAFGKNTSCIGLATNKTLNPEDTANYKWTDHGKIIQSFPGKTNWNAIDPNLITDKKGHPFLVFGSFWDGIKIIQLKTDRMSIAESTDHLPTIASRNKAGDNAIEAPFIFKTGNYYYLFTSIDYCCKGVNSTYKMIIGRSKNIKGPYLDKEGVDMAHGGGSILLQGDKNWYGVGHSATYTFDNIDYLIFHGYDATDNGKSKLIIDTLEWEKGWPLIK